jgi:hypothetical protein
MKKLLLIAAMLFCLIPTSWAYQQENLKEGIPFTGKITNGEKRTYSVNDEEPVAITDGVKRWL